MSLGTNSSDDPEYWVFRASNFGAGKQDLEIGRVRSTQLGPLVERLGRAGR